MAESFPGPWKLGPRSGVNGMAVSLDLYLGPTWESLSFFVRRKFGWKFLLEVNFVSCDEVIQSLRSLPLLCDVACRLPRLGSCALWKVGYGRVVISCFLMCCFSCHLGRIRWYLLDCEIFHGFSVISAKVCVLSMAFLLCASMFLIFGFFWSSSFMQETTGWFCPISISSSCSPGNSSTIQALEALRRPWTSTAFFYHLPCIDAQCIVVPHFVPLQ